LERGRLDAIAGELPSNRASRVCCICQLNIHCAIQQAEMLIVFIAVFCCAESQIAKIEGSFRQQGGSRQSAPHRRVSPRLPGTNTSFSTTSNVRGISLGLSHSLTPFMRAMNCHKCIGECGDDHAGVRPSMILWVGRCGAHRDGSYDGIAADLADILTRILGKQPYSSRTTRRRAWLPSRQPVVHFSTSAPVHRRLGLHRKVDDEF
jgi:hypothetical protein